jgi:hypothetical protein
MAREPHPWPGEGFVAIAGAESPDRYVFLPVVLIGSRTAASPETVLRTSGEQLWLATNEQQELRVELEGLLSTATDPNDVETIRAALGIVDYELARGAGVLIVPPGALNATYHFPTAWQRIRNWCWQAKRLKRCVPHSAGSGLHSPKLPLFPGVTPS